MSDSRPRLPRRLPGSAPTGGHAPADIESALSRFLDAQAPAEAPPDDSVTLAVNTSWKQALLDDLGAAPGTGATGPSPLPPSAPPGWIPPAIEWGSVPARAVPIAPGERVPVYPAEPVDPPAVLRFLTPGEPPQHMAVYQGLLHYLYGPSTRAIAASIRREPLFTYALGRWRPARPGTAWYLDRSAREGNLELLHVLYDRLSKLMASYYDFDPAPLAYLPEMEPGALGLYFPAHKVLCVSSRLLGGPLHEVVDTIVHEQVHAYQFQTLARFWAGARFEPYQESVLKLWSIQEATRARGANLHLGIEIHAYGVGTEAGEAIRRLPGA